MPADNQKLNIVWRICNKIRTLLARYAIDIKSKLESQADNDFLSTTSFLNVINNLNPKLQLSEQEQCELSNFFKTETGEVNCKKFIEILQLNLDDDNGNKQYVTGLEWEDPLQINLLTPFEHRHVNMILTKIAHTCRFRDINLEPYFQDYEEMSKNNGTITVCHFRRVLNFLGITVGVKEFRLLLKKF